MRFKILYDSLNFFWEIRNLGDSGKNNIKMKLTTAIMIDILASTFQSLLDDYQKYKQTVIFITEKPRNMKSPAKFLFSLGTTSTAYTYPT